MIFRQLFDSVSGTYTYLLASRSGGEALIIDPVLEKVERYLQLISELDLKLVKAVDTHLHADQGRHARRLSAIGFILRSVASLLLSMTSKRIRRNLIPPCAEANSLMMSHDLIALGSLPQRLPQQKATETKKSVVIGFHRA